MRDYETAARFDREAHDRELLALAAEQRLKAAEHRVRAEELRAEDAVLSQSEREERIRQRTARQHERERRGARRLRPGTGSSFYSPGMVGTAGTTSRLAARAREILDREIEAIRQALDEHGAIDRDELRRLVEGGLWGPGRFQRAVREALHDGDAMRVSPSSFGPPEQPEPSQPPEPPEQSEQAEQSERSPTVR
jgi:hypothetical protein